MIASFVTFIIASGSGFANGLGANKDAAVLLVTVAVTTGVWLAATFATQPESPAVLESFYQRVRPGGPGWRPVSEKLGFGVEPIAAGRHAWLNWIAGVVAVYSSLFGIGKLIFGHVALGLGLLVLAGAAFAWIARALNAQDKEAPSVA
jgi:hypothetical protein